MRRFGRCHCRPVPLAAGRRQIKSERGYSSMEAAIARSHIKLWWGDLVISSRASRHPEEQNGEVSAFMIGETCFAWWSNDQLRVRLETHPDCASRRVSSMMEAA